MIGSGFQKESFQQRLTRIHQGGEHTTRHLYVGPVEDAKPDRSSRRARREAAALARGPRRRLLTELLILPFAAALGGLAVVAARALGFHFLGGVGFYADHAWYADLGMAVIIALILRAALKMSGGMRGKAFFAGFAVLVLFQGLLVVRAPEVFGLIYSDAYVAETVALVGPV